MPPRPKFDPETGEILICAVEECPGVPTARGWCDKHYRRWRKYGDVSVVQSPLEYVRRADLVEKFWSLVNTEGPPSPRFPELGPCWIWTGTIAYNGYGQLSITYDWERITWAAHRFAYELIVDVIPEGLELDHLCCVRNCVNPQHLEPVTHAENIARAHARGSYNRISNGSITECPQGHPYDEANTYTDKEGRSYCRQCLAAKQRRRYATPAGRESILATNRRSTERIAAKNEACIECKERPRYGRSRRCSPCNYRRYDKRANSSHVREG